MTQFHRLSLVLFLALCLQCSDASEQPAHQSVPNPGSVELSNTKQAAPEPAIVPTESASLQPEPPAEMPDPQTLDPEMPIPAGILHEAFYANKDAWLGKKVTVVGYYKGNTHSSATDQTRVDLKTGQLGKTVVGCYMPGKDVVPKSVAEARADVLMRGTIAEPFFGQVVLKDSVFVNRN